MVSNHFIVCSVSPSSYLFYWQHQASPPLPDNTATPPYRPPPDQIASLSNLVTTILLLGHCSHSRLNSSNIPIARTGPVQLHTRTTAVSDEYWGCVFTSKLKRAERRKRQIVATKMLQLMSSSHPSRFTSLNSYVHMKEIMHRTERTWTSSAQGQCWSNSQCNFCLRPTPGNDIPKSHSIIWVLPPLTKYSAGHKFVHPFMMTSRPAQTRGMS